MRIVFLAAAVLAMWPHFVAFASSFALISVFWIAHVSILRPHPPFVAPEPYNRMYDPVTVPGFARQRW